MMSNRYRLLDGGAIDRERPVTFRFNGEKYQGYEGDSLASALIANGVRLTARSFKYHRPRGIMGAGAEEPSSIVELLGDGQSGNVPVTRVMLRDGLDARSVNCWPSPGFDMLAVNQIFSRLLPAAFYYKTFKWPDWRLFEPYIRRAAGLASAPAEPSEPLNYETRNWHCNVLVAGAGPAGLMAALAAGRSGARVLLADDDVMPGASLIGHQLHGWISGVVAEIDQMPNVRRLRDATVWAYRENNLCLVCERSPVPGHVYQRTWRVRAGRVVIATGAIERPLVFENNDRPGVMLASAVGTYIRRFGVRPGENAIVFTNNSSALQVANDLKRAGIEVAAIVDSRKTDMTQAGHLPGHVVSTVHGGRRVRAVSVKDGVSGATHRIECDLVCVSGGWSPAVHLFSQSRGTLRYDDTIAAFVADEPAQTCLCAGAAAGMFTLPRVLRDGAQKGAMAAEACGFAATMPDLPDVPAEPDYDIRPLWHVPSRHPSAKAFVDVQNDVTVADVHLAMREGFGAVEHVKRYTTAGMGIDQGKTGNINVIGVIAGQSGTAMQEIGTTTFRPPYTPVDFGSVSGTREGSVFLPYRHTPITRWNKDHGAMMYEAGARWRRPGYYPLPGETFQDSVNRECRAVREAAAVYDGAPLGKYEVRGRDALKFLDMIYTNAFDSLETGMGRYGIMLTEDGTILDDGVTFRLGDDHYLISTSTGQADTVNQHMEHFLQIERPEWDVKLTTVTTQWANATVCGPRAREVMAALGTDLDLGREAMPFMAMREATVAGIPARVCRVSFTGELSFEINVWPRHQLQLWEAILEAGKPYGLIPIGSEANHVLRVEKGFLSIGHEVDGTVDPYDLCMDWIMSRKKADFIGKRSVELRRSGGKPRRELVGLLTDDPKCLVTEGAPLTPGGRHEASEGFVSASVWSVVNDRSVALGLLRDGRNRMGETVYVRMKSDVVPAKVVAPCFHDPDGERLKG